MHSFTHFVAIRLLESIQKSEGKYFCSYGNGILTKYVVLIYCGYSVYPFRWKSERNFEFYLAFKL